MASTQAMFRRFFSSCRNTSLGFLIRSRSTEALNGTEGVAVGTAVARRPPRTTGLSDFPGSFIAVVPFSVHGTDPGGRRGQTRDLPASA
jgi:hypothetical protein